MKGRQIAILYIRVSTDEQAEKGYSLKHQEERLRQYCDFQNIEVLAVYREDHSAKNFERPEFTKLLTFLKKSKGAADLLLFLKWDRFSRNAGDAYGMINQLGRLGVEPQAIEQPLDLDIPENKIMLAFYLAAPEVENDRRSLNTIAGMRRAMKDGRHVTLAPKGYRNARNEINKPIIVSSADAELVCWVFEEVAKGIRTINDVWREARKKGLNSCKNQIWNMLRNPVYCGEIFIPAYKDEPEMLVKASHEPLITKELFYEVQDVLHGRKRKFPSKKKPVKELPLRGFLDCRKCGGRISGSASKGNGGRYFYYHCSKGCNERFKAELANSEIEKYLQKISLNRGGIAALKRALMDYAKDSSVDKATTIKQINQEIEKNQERLSKAQAMLFDGEIEASDYRDAKNRYEPLILKLERRKKELGTLDQNLPEIIHFAEDFFTNLSKYFAEADLTAKRQLIGSVFPEKLVFDEKTFRTIKVLPTIEWMMRRGKDCKELNKKKASKNGGQFNLVHRTSPSSNFWVNDLKNLFDFQLR